MTKIFSPFEWAAVVFLVLVILFEISRASHLPRHYVTTLNGRVVSDIVVTNPVYVHYVCQARFGTNGSTELYMQPVTNVLWHQWRLFK